MKDFWFREDLEKSQVYHTVDEGTHTRFGDQKRVVRNPYVRLRDRKLRPVSDPPGNPLSSIQAGQRAGQQKKEPTELSSKVKQQPSSQKKEVATVSNRAAPKTILQSFAKAPANPVAKSTKPVKHEVESATALSDDGEPDDSDNLPTKPKSGLQSNSRSRRDREEALRRMMESEDEQEKQDRQNDSANDTEMKESPEPEAEPEPVSETLSTALVDKEPSEIISSTGDGRRRGKRRIVKKKRILDDQGYMGKCYPSVHAAWHMNLWCEQ